MQRSMELLIKNIVLFSLFLQYICTKKTVNMDFRFLIVRICCLCLILGTSCHAFASKTLIPFNLLQNELITATTSDAYGRFWIGTTKGLFLFDGTNLFKYKRSKDTKAVLESCITSLCIMNDNTLVAGTFNGLYIYNAQKDEFDEVESPIPITRIQCILPDGKVLCLNSVSKTLYLTDLGMNKIYRELVLDSVSDRIMFIPLSNGNIAMCYGIQYTVFSPDLEILQKGKLQSEMNDVCEFQSRIVFSTREGLETYSLEGLRVSNIPALDAFIRKGNVRFLASGTNGKVFFGLMEKGIYSYQPETEYIQLLTNDVDGFALNSWAPLIGIDSANKLWLKDGNSLLGCKVFNTSSRYRDWEILVDVNNTHKFKEIVQFTLQGRNLYFITKHAIYFYNQESKSSEELFSLPDVNLKDIVADSFGRIFVLSEKAVYYFEEEHRVIRKLTDIPFYPLSNYAVGKDYLTFLCQGMLVTFDKDLHEIDQPIPSYNLRSALCLNSDMENAYVFLNGYTALYHPSRGLFDEKYDPNQAYDGCYTIRGDDGKVWMATYQYGLIGLDLSSGKTDTLNVARGLDDNHIYTIKQDAEEDIWISTTNGLSKYSPDKHVITNYGELGNLLFDLSNNHLKTSKDREVYVYSSRYILKYSPEKYRNNTKPARPHFFSASVNNTSFYGMPENLSLSHEENNLSVSFATIDLLYANLLSYEYTLKGFETIWHETTNGDAVYNNLPPGKYELMVKAKFTSGDYSEVRVLPVVIHPAFYQTLWFKLLVLLILGTLLLLGIRFFIRTRISVAEYKFRADKERMKVDLYTNLSHLIRTPVSLVNAPFKQLVQGHEWSAKDNQLIEIINKNMERIMDLTQQFLENWSETGEANDPMDQTLHLAEKDLARIIRETAMVFRPTAAQKGITISLDTQESMKLNVDEDKVVKILYNLVSNALKHTPMGGDVKISAIKQENQVELKVADTGEGIPDSKKNKIFDLFYMGTENTQKGESFGVGLYHTKSLIDTYKGKIHVADNKPCGTVFTFILPVTEESKTNSSKTIEENLNQDIGLLIEQDITRLLIVEDNEDMLAYLSTSLQEKYQVSVARDGMEALKFFEEECIDIVISDVMMPRMDGLALCRWIKENPEFSHIPVVLLTAKSARTDELEGLGCGADYYLRKPFEMDLLQAVVESLVENRKKVQKVLLKRFLEKAHLGESLEEEKKEEPTIQMNARDKEFLDCFYDLLQKHMKEEGYSVEELSREMGFSKSNLYKKVRALTGCTPNDIMTQVKFAKVEELMQTGLYTLSEISYQTGFSSISTFSRRFHSIYGVSPTEYLKKKGLREG